MCTGLNLELTSRGGAAGSASNSRNSGSWWLRMSWSSSFLPSTLFRYFFCLSRIAAHDDATVTQISLLLLKRWSDRRSHAACMQLVPLEIYTRLIKSSLHIIRELWDSDSRAVAGYTSWAAARWFVYVQQDFDKNCMNACMHDLLHPKQNYGAMQDDLSS